MIDMSEKAIAKRIQTIMEDITNGRGELNMDTAIACLVGKVVALELLLTATNDRITALSERTRQTGNE